MHSRPFPAKNAAEIGTSLVGERSRTAGGNLPLRGESPGAGQVSPIQFAVISFEEHRGDHEREWCGQRGDWSGLGAVDVEGVAPDGRLHRLIAIDEASGGRCLSVCLCVFPVSETLIPYSSEAQ